MKTLILIVLSFAFLQPLTAKEQLPAIVFGLKNDTLHGEIKVTNAFDKGKDRAYAYLHFSIDFTEKGGKTGTFQPGEIAGFLIWTSDSTFEKFVSAKLDLSAPEEEESAFGRPGMAARLELNKNAAFVRVLKEERRMELFAFYEEDVLEYNKAGAPPTLYNSLNERFMLRKDKGAFIKLNSRNKRRKAQLLEIFGDCEKVKNVLEKQKLDTKDEKVMIAILSTYNSNCNH